MNKHLSIVLRPFANHDLIHEVPVSWFGLTSFFLACILQGLFDVNLNIEKLLTYGIPIKYFLFIFNFFVLHLCCRLFKGVGTLVLFFRAFSIASIPLILSVLVGLASMLLSKSGSVSSEFITGCFVVRIIVRIWVIFLIVALVRFIHRQTILYFIYSVVLTFTVLMTIAVMENYFFNSEVWDIGTPSLPERYYKSR